MGGYRSEDPHMRNFVIILAVCSLVFLLLSSLIRLSDQSRIACEGKDGVELRTLDGTVCAKVELIK